MVESFPILAIDWSTRFLSLSVGSGSDLTPITTRGLLFNQANTLRPVTISLVNDMRLENNETFRAQLVSVLADPDITIAPDEAGLTILDDDCECLI